MLGYKKGSKKLLTGQIPLHYPGDRVYLDGDPTKTVQDKCARKADLTNLDLTGTTNTTGSTITGGTFFYLNGTLVRAKTAIASGATFTLNTNYEVVTAGALNSKANILTNQNYNYVDGTTFGGSGFSALESANGSTRYRLVLGNDGSVSRFKSTDGGATWGSQTIIL